MGRTQIVEDGDGTITTCWVSGHTLPEVFTAAAQWAAEHDGVKVEAITLSATDEHPYALALFYSDWMTPHPAQS